MVVLASVVFFIFAKKTEAEKQANGSFRIVSLMPSLTQSIHYLDAQDKLVGCTSYCWVAPEDSVEVVSSAVKPNIEKIVSLNPDIVLVSGLIPEKELETLRKFGIRVEIFYSPKTFLGICSEFMRLGKLVGKEDNAEKIIAESKAKVVAIQKQVEQAQIRQPKVFMQIGADPIFTVLPNTFMNDYIVYCGGVNIADNLTSGTIGREFVVAQNPDYIFIVTMGLTGKNEAEQWAQFKQMNAVINEKIFILNSDIACQPTPITFVETLELVNKLITE